MRARSLWANLQGFPDPVFNLQGDSSERPVRPLQQPRRILEAGAGLARSQRDSRPTQRVGGRQKEFKEKGQKREVGSRSKGSAKAIVHTRRNIKTTHGTFEQ